MPEWITWGLHPDFLLTLAVIAVVLLIARPWRQEGDQ